MQAVYIRLKAKYIRGKKKRKIINKYCGLPRRFKQKFLVYFSCFLVFVCVFCFLFLVVVAYFFPLTIMKVRKVKLCARYQIML